jgi:hypothetical protein
MIGNNDHTDAEAWYYAVTAYNGWSSQNNPNQFVPDRPPYDGTQSDPALHYPYEELVWGWMTYPEHAQDGSHWLWRKMGIAWVPRGIWGDPSQGEDWHPPAWTPKPVFSLLSGIYVANGSGPTIILHNTSNHTLAVDIALYNEDHTFNRWWLGAPPSDNHIYPSRYIRLLPDERREIAAASAFHGWETFIGYARISASEGVEVTLQPPPYPNKVFLPLALKQHGGNCYEGIANGGFEGFQNGKPRYWSVSSTDAYPLADGT